MTHLRFDIFQIFYPRPFSDLTYLFTKFRPMTPLRSNIFLKFLDPRPSPIWHFLLRPYIKFNPFSTFSKNIWPRTISYMTFSLETEYYVRWIFTFSKFWTKTHLRSNYSSNSQTITHLRPRLSLIFLAKTYSLWLIYAQQLPFRWTLVIISGLMSSFDYRVTTCVSDMKPTSLLYIEARLMYEA